MIRSISSLGLALFTTLLAAGCSLTDGAGKDAADADGGSSSSSSGTENGGASKGGAKGELAFAPANVPADAPLTASGDWIFNTETCGRSKVTIDTAKGTVSCQGQAKDAFVFKAVTQSDMSQGTLTAGLFVTRRLVIEPSMVVDVVGNRPLIIVALDTVTIQGSLRATLEALESSKANGGGFDGVDEPVRGNGPGGGAQRVGHVGAGGGGHCGVGGGGASGGKAYGNAANTPLLGGSSGGGANDSIGSGGGGGGVQIVAGASIEISGVGVIDVSGGGGKWRGAGGGAGGAILLEAPTVSIFGTLAANGGGGAQGSQNGEPSNGNPSADPAKGAPGSFGYGTGGDGAAGTSIDGQTGAQPEKSDLVGGGGGGAAGRIRINTTSGAATLGATAVISPALTTRCATHGIPAAH